VHFLYGSKADGYDPQRILFLPRLMDLIAAADDPGVTLRCFLTGLDEDGIIEHGKLPNRTFGRRLKEGDLLRAIDGYAEGGTEADYDRRNTVCMVCGPPAMTDELVAFLRQQTDMSESRVLCEKWW
jgi:hypothetical protein